MPANTDRTVPRIPRMLPPTQGNAADAKDKDSTRTPERTQSPTHAPPAPRPAHPSADPNRIRHHALGLAFNAILPGTGSLYIGRRIEGRLQLAVLAAGIATLLFLVGLALVAAAWIWAVVGSIEGLVTARRKETYSKSKVIG